MNYPIIQSKRCHITIATTDDACWLHALLNDKDVYKYIDGIRPFAENIKSTTLFIEDMLDAYINGRGFLWKLSINSIPIGFICTLDIEEAPSVCYGMDKAYRNLGIMLESLTCVMYYQIQISDSSFQFHISKENLASLRLYTKIARMFNTSLYIDNEVN